MKRWSEPQNKYSPHTARIIRQRLAGCVLIRRPRSIGAADTDFDCWILTAADLGVGAFAVQLAGINRQIVPTLSAQIAGHGAELVAAVRACSRNWFREHRLRAARHIDAVDSDNTHLAYGHATALHVIEQIYPLEA